ncbi:hypothetical protein [uncultured Roseibium sp.]|uniref:hypothetical protein n=1 Tax=uncultured Roseibium sp. TaxID=1936171 RepID=UPI002638B08B|nr:hypothetical protein [uncultured Roseibium sp.]
MPKNTRKTAKPEAASIAALEKRITDLERKLEQVGRNQGYADQAQERIQKAHWDVAEQCKDSADKLETVLAVLTALDKAFTQYGEASNKLREDERFDAVATAHSESLGPNVKVLQKRTKALTRLAADLNSAIADYTTTRRQKATGAWLGL